MHTSNQHYDKNILIFNDAIFIIIGSPFEVTRDAEIVDSPTY